MSAVSLFEDDFDISVPCIPGRGSRSSLPQSSTGESQKPAFNAIDQLRAYMNRSQLSTVTKCMHGEEKQFFFDKMAELANTIETMPVTYQQDGKGDDALAYLHYFHGGSDWYITELDMDGGVDQAFGYACLNGDLMCAELGYISIAELVGYGVELDFYFKPTTLRNIKESLNRRHGRVGRDE